MKELVALFMLVVLVGMGWNQPYRKHFEYFSRLRTGAPKRPVAPTVTPPRDTSWMFNR